MKKLTKKQFCILYPDNKKLRYSDPIQFNVLFFEWTRKYKNFLKY